MRQRCVCMRLVGPSSLPSLRLLHSRPAILVVVAAAVLRGTIYGRVSRVLFAPREFALYCSSQLSVLLFQGSEFHTVRFDLGREVSL